MIWPTPSSSHQPTHGSAWACSACWETAVRCPSCSKYARIFSSVTTRETAGVFACFMDSTTSFSSACVRPSTSSVYTRSPAEPMPTPARPLTSLTAYESDCWRLASGIVPRYCS